MDTTITNMELRYHVDTDHLTLKTFDSINKDALVQLITKSVSKAKEHNCKRILFDHRGCHLDISYIELHLIISDLEKLGLTSDYRCVVIYNVDAEKYKFSDTVIHNWCGWIVRFYDSFEEGVNWLLK